MTGRRDDVLATLRAARTPLTIVEIADQLEIHPNTARFHLEALVESGRVESVEPARSKPGRPPLMFRAAAGMDPSGPRDYQMLASVLVEAIANHPRPGAEAASAGRRWAKRHTDRSATRGRRPAIVRLTEMLADMGFAPETDSDTAVVKEIRLRNCPFLDLYASHGEVICPVHLGLMQGAMTAWQAPLTVTSLTPFADPDMCVARLGPARRSR